MFYEKRVSTFKALMEELDALDSDSGVRVVGRYGRAGCFAFATKIGGRFTVMIYENKRGAPGRRLASVDVERKELEKILRQITGDSVDAYVY